MHNILNIWSMFITFSFHSPLTIILRRKGHCYCFFFHFQFSWCSFVSLMWKKKSLPGLFTLTGYFYSFISLKYLFYLLLWFFDWDLHMMVLSYPMTKLMMLRRNPDKNSLTEEAILTKYYHNALCLVASFEVLHFISWY